MALKDFKNFGNQINRGFQKTGIALGKFTNNTLLPAVTTIGIPLASAAVGAAASEIGSPALGMVASTATDKLLHKYIPQQYQSNNKYVGLLADAASQAAQGDTNPQDYNKILNKGIGYITQDINGKKPVRDPGDPYGDLIQQLMNSYNQPQIPDVSSEPQTSNPVDAVAKQYAGDTIQGNDIIEPSSIYASQRSGSLNGLLGGGLTHSRVQPLLTQRQQVDAYVHRLQEERRAAVAQQGNQQNVNPRLMRLLRRARAANEVRPVDEVRQAEGVGGVGLKKVRKNKKRKNLKEERINKVEVIEKIPFSKTNNASLTQLIEATKRKEEILNKKELLEIQRDALQQLKSLNGGNLMHNRKRIIL